MTWEDRIVSELRAERAAVPRAGPDPMPGVPTRGRRPATVAASLLVVVALGLLLERSVGPGTGVAGVAAGPGQVVLGGELVVPVTGDKVILGGVMMDVAAAGPALDDDAEIPGTEVELDRSGPPGQGRLPNDTGGPMVYVGTVADQAVVLHDDHPPVGGVGEELAGLIERLTTGPMFCTNTDGCSEIGDGPQVSLGHSRTGMGPFMVSATGFILPPETAAVAVTTGDGAAYWQRPAGNAIIIRWEQPQAPRPPYRFVGYNSVGDEIFSQALE